MSETTHIKNVIEAALLAAGRPLQIAEIAQLFDESVRPPNAEIRAALATLAAEYESRGIEIKETASGFRIQVRKELANEISRLWPERPPRYSRALLETLAIIAYRQPITRAEIEAVRGVSVNPNIIRTLLERNWVRVVGTRDIPGRPELLGTTREFLDYFGLKSLEDLPPLAELKAVADFNVQLELPTPEDAPPAGEVSASGEANDAGAEVKEESAAASEGAEPESVASEPVAEAAEVAELLESPAPPKLARGRKKKAVPPPEAESGAGESAGAEPEVAESEGDNGDEESGEDEELSAHSESESELVAAPRDVND